MNEKTNAKEEAARELGFCETACALNQERWQGSSLVQQLVHFTGALSQQDLTAALTCLMTRHPLLNATMESVKDVPYRFHIHAASRQPPLLVKACATRPAFTLDEANDDSRYLEDAMFRPFPGDDLLWRVEYFKAEDGEHALLFHFHHAISDLISVALFTHDLFMLASGQGKAREALPLMDNMENYFVRDAAAADEAAPAQAEPPTPVFPAFEANVPLSERRTRNIYREISAETISGLRAACEKRGVNIRTLLGAAMAMASQGQAGTGAAVPIFTVFDGRLLCAEPGGAKGSFGNEHFGYYALVQFTTPQLADSVWDTADSHQAGLDAALRASAQAGYVPTEVDKEGLWQMVSAGLDALNESQVFTSGTAVFIGDAQCLRADDGARTDYGPLHIESSWLWTAQQTGMFMATLCGYFLHGKFYACISHPDPLTSRQRALEIAQNFVALLEQARG